MTRTAWHLLVVGVLASVGVMATTPVAAQNIAVTAANPPTGEQDTSGLVVKITGKNFQPGARSDFFKSGTTDPAGVTVRSTQFVSSTEVDAIIDIGPTAAVSLFDIKVTNTSGRSGKGGDLFSVTVKGGGAEACDAGTYTVDPPAMVINTAPGDAACQIGVSGVLDCTFGIDGVVTTGVRPPYGLARDMVAQPDGKLVVLVLGYPPDSTTGTEMYVVRYNPNGSLDTTFGSGGITHPVFTSQTDTETPSAIALQADGKLLVTGHYVVPKSGTGGVSTAALMRLLSNGSVDSTFGSAGRATLAYGSPKTSSFARDVLVQADGRILVVGHTAEQLAVTRFTTNGTLDTLFGSGGRALVPVVMTGPYANNALAAALQEFGGQQSLVVAGSTQTCPSGPPKMAALRFTPNGGIDTGFGTSGNGRAFVDFLGTFDAATDLSIDAENRIVLAGYSGPVAAITRLTPQGLLDEAFGTGGAARVSAVGKDHSYLARVSIDDIGRIVVAGHVYKDWYGSFVVARYLSDGTLDPTFGSDGVTITDFTMGNGDDIAHGLTIQPNGRIVVTGYASPSYVGLAGYTP
jgi:uncharacterized delta-60 repeat protein